ncbi:hypothetical protein BOTNAR_0055g00080 [Botryotinia narcissicola]|uniref:Uncharacterized protein n=1 Tax=Botryotinia narcissicola TaxID=278944 RepID=A0A4Z1J585_9HELO|nr:hypothetical protein BOTNAR_0055g00080 [Botryotinia narcissicola]
MMNFSLSQLYDRFTARPKEMTVWEMEDWIDEKSKRTGRGYYIPKGEIFCRALNQDGSLCKYTRRVGLNKNILAHCSRNLAIEYHALAPRKSGITKRENGPWTVSGNKCFKYCEQMILISHEYGTWEELTFMIKVYELLEKQLESEKVAQVQQSGNTSGATEQHDLALISLKRPRTDVSSTTSVEKARGAKSIAAMGKVSKMQNERQKIVSPHERACSYDPLTFDVHHAPADIKGTIRTTSATASRREVARNRSSYVF